MKHFKYLALALALTQDVLATSPPQVTLDFGTFQGSNNAATGVDNFLGVPFATAGRLENPVLVSSQNKLSGIQDATKYGPACPQTELVASPASQNPLSSTVGELLGFVEALAFSNITEQSEDCLSINVQCVPHMN
jgi:carboxylesterase type B